MPRLPRLPPWPPAPPSQTRIKTLFEQPGVRRRPAPQELVERYPAAPPRLRRIIVQRRRTPSGPPLQEYLFCVGGGRVGESVARACRKPGRGSSLRAAAALPPAGRSLRLGAPFATGSTYALRTSSSSGALVQAVLQQPLAAGSERCRKPWAAATYPPTGTYLFILVQKEYLTGSCWASAAGERA